MSDPNDLIVVEPDGRVRVAGRGAERRMRDRAGRYRLTVDSPGLLIMRREREEDDRLDGARVIMAGEIISKMSVLEIISVIANAGWRGDLTVLDQEGVQREMQFDQGALKHGRSSHPDDRLGEVLYRQGVVTRIVLESILREITPDRRFGEICIDKGILTPEELFAHLRRQAEQIFYATLLVADGTYVFRTVDDQASPAAHTLHVPIQGLLMEGVQRIDEMALFRERIPSDDMCPVPKDGAADKQLEATAKKVLAMCDGQRTIADISRETGLGDFLTTKTIYHLLQQSQIELHQPTKVDKEQILLLVRQFNDVMRDIFMAVATYGGVDATRKTLSAWIQGSGYTPFFGSEIDEDGTLDANFVAEVISGIQHARPIEALHQALHELAAFALFSATAALPRDQEMSLARDVNRRLKAIRI